MSTRVAASPMAMARQYSDMLVVVAVVLIVMMMVIPLPPFILDLLLATNISLAILLLLLTMNVSGALELSVFPSLLLVTTLFRLALNVSSTRLILLNGYAGKIINAFGNFVVGGNYVVGFVVFLILVVIQFIVITKGAERVAEVAARFTLDAMPGKQMSIDADLNAGLINEVEARQRRRDIEREADFYGAMDGASKFVKGDAIAGIIIIIINILGGFAIGILQKGLPLAQALQRYTLLTVGDGLVTQIPALLISVATGIIVTRAASDGNMGQDVIQQLLAQPKVLYLGAGALALFGLIPGMPTIPFWALAGGAAYLARSASRAIQVEEEKEEEKQREAELEAAKKPENVLSLLSIDPIEMEIGYSLIPLVDPAQGGDLFDRINLIRRQTALDLGMIIPTIRVRDNMQLKPGAYSLKIKGVEVAHAELMVNHFLAMDTGSVKSPVQGVSIIEPAFGLPALWIEANRREETEMAGYTVVDPPSVLATHLTEALRSHAYELLGRQEVKNLIDGLKEEYSAVVEELIPDLLNLGEVQKVLQNLLREEIPIRNLVTILEALADYARATKDTDLLTEYVRQALARQISHMYADEKKKLLVATLDPGVEETITRSIQVGEQGKFLSIEPRAAQKLLGALAGEIQKFTPSGRTPVILCGAQVRPYFKRLTERAAPKLAVLSYNEISPDLEVQSVGMVSIGNESQAV